MVEKKLGHIKNYCQPSNISVTSSEPSASTSTTSTTSFISRKKVLDAEILWLFKCISSHYSYSSCQGIKEIFTKMFPDSVIAKQFSMGDKKCSYMCNFGIAPYFKSQLQRHLNSVRYFTLLFDETLNKTNQKKQLDIHVRFWHPEDNQVKTQYLTSAFLGHSTAEDIFKAFYDAVESLNLSKLIQISMDGPNVNWSFYEKLQQDLLKEYNCNCAKIGSCGLHIMNNAFRKGASTTEWEISTVLTSLYWLFNDSPARRDDFIQLSSLKKLPVKFCNYRWLENVPATERALLIWEDVKKYVKNVEIGKFSKINSKSFRIIVEASKDNLFPVKMQFFLSVAKLLKPFLEVYQSDAPLLPFFAEDVFQLIKNCLELYNVIKPNTINEISSAEKLCNFDFSDKKLHSSISKISIGFIGDKMLSDMLRKKDISESLLLPFKKECQVFVITMIEKILTKCPIRYAFVRNAACLDPRLMARDEVKCYNKMKKLLFYLVHINHVNEEDCDEILMEFKEFFNVVKSTPSQFRDFDMKSMRLDVFLFSHVSNEKMYLKLWETMKMIMIFSHGQASVERGFSINKQI